MNVSAITLWVSEPQLQTEAAQICQHWGFSLVEQPSHQGFQLGFSELGLQLFNRDEPQQNPIIVDFVTGANAHRRKFGGGKSQAIAKAAGLKSGYRPRVIDGTAGLGKDAYVLASLGCQVTLIERHPVVAALLADGLSRAYRDPEIGDWMQQRMRLSDHRHIAQLVEHTQLSSDADTNQVDVVYLDPMYPHRDKSALVKKDMRTFQTLVGSDDDAADLLAPALVLANKRVVVKRPDYGQPLANRPPTMQIITKKNRFDVYVNQIKA